MLIELNETQHRNLLAFLDRVDMRGSEALAYLEILKALNRPILQLPTETSTEATMGQPVEEKPAENQD